ncbi:diguanylate cyclase (GGDEF)-like protein [Halospina denitrificans]|uniref:diguanylate cyclase n=1 Tax=Halospina denitrificans TaxID=332522 RepID=A0A4R7JWD5_9GAMM|nr:sensor domain-containing diguanylate cyclase [Halospina denitrificans]TDT41763.1 diguanylate cyclase (GGDEF)-like protein [Halospina denitrificans]
MSVPVTDVPDIHLLKGMLDTMIDHVFLMRVEEDRYRMVYCNHAMENFMHASRSMLQDRFLDDIIPDPVLYQRITDNYQRALAADRALRYEETTEGFQPAPYTIFDTRIAPLTASDGQVRYICGISRDITARRNAETALQHTNQTLKHQLVEIQRLQEQLQNDAVRDPLTNLFNRRYFMESLTRELHRAQRENYPITLMMLDIDYFKSLNDDFGHAAGDRVLTAFSHQLREGMRTEDVVSRWGGEEFLIMMPGLALKDARNRIETWRQNYSPMAITLGGRELNIRFSAGLATAPQHGLDPDELINAADAALYHAKTEGRDQVQVFQSYGIEADRTNESAE